MNKLFYIISFVFSTIICSCDQCHVEYAPYLDSKVYDYFAFCKTGSYWVYGDSLGNTDSSWISSCQSSGGGNQEICQSLYTKKKAMGPASQLFSIVMNTSFSNTSINFEVARSNTNSSDINTVNATVKDGSNNSSSDYSLEIDSNKLKIRGYNQFIKVKDYKENIYDSAIWISCSGKYPNQFTFYFIRGIGPVQKDVGFWKNGLVYTTTMRLKRYNIVR